MKPSFLAVLVLGLFAALAIWLLAGLAKPPQYPARQDVIHRPAPSPTPVANHRGWIEIQADRWNRARVRPEKLHFAQAIAAQITRNRARYQAVANQTGVPWQVIGCLHNMEASLSFRCNLAQGDPLTARSRNVPRGRPPTGSPPFSWEYAAKDALLFDHLNRADWSDIGHELDNFEHYNGIGSRQFGVPSAYLWSWTTLYDPPRGKYVADGKWSSTAASQQCGVAPILKYLPAL